MISMFNRTRFFSSILGYQIAHSRKGPKKGEKDLLVHHKVLLFQGDV